MGLLADPNIMLIHYLPGLEEGIESFGTGVIAHCSNQVGVGNKVKVLWISRELLTRVISPASQTGFCLRYVRLQVNDL